MSCTKDRLYLAKVAGKNVNRPRTFRRVNAHLAAVFNQGANLFLSFQDVIGIDFRRAPLGSKF